MGCGFLRAPPAPYPVPDATTADVLYTWRPLAPMSVRRYENLVAVVDGKMHVFGGLNRDFKVTAVAEVYDASLDTWTRIADLPQAITHANGAVDGRRIWFAGGFEGNHPGKVVSNVWYYDVDKDQYFDGPSLPEARAGGIIALLGRNIHYCGGLKADRHTDAEDHWVMSLDGEKDWSLAAPMPNPRNHLGGAVLDGLIYAIGGQFGHDPADNSMPVDVPFVDVYDPNTDTWRPVRNLPRPMSHFEPGCFVYNGAIIISGGRYVAEDLEDIWAYRPELDEWQALPPLPGELRAPSVRILGDQIVVAGGGYIGVFAQTATWGGALTGAWSELVSRK